MGSSFVLFYVCMKITLGQFRPWKAVPYKKVISRGQRATVTTAIVQNSLLCNSDYITVKTGREAAP